MQTPTSVPHPNLENRKLWAQDLVPHPSLVNQKLWAQDLAFNRLTRWFWSMMKFKHCYPRPVVTSELPTVLVRTRIAGPHRSVFSEGEDVKNLHLYQIPRWYRYCEARDHTLRILRFPSDTSTYPTNTLKFSKCRTRCIHAQTHITLQTSLSSAFPARHQHSYHPKLRSVCLSLLLHLSFFLTSCINFQVLKRLIPRCRSHLFTVSSPPTLGSYCLPWIPVQIGN